MYNENEVVYSEVFTKHKVLKNDIDYVLREISKVHTSEAGWVVGNPEIYIDSPDGSTVTMSVQLTKYAKTYNKRF